jgi:hypothetical protein
MTRFHIPPVLRRWRAVATIVGVAAIAGGGVLMAAPSDPQSALSFHTVNTTRLLDTRPATQVGTRSTPLGLQETFDLAIAGLPDDATTVSINVTVVDGTEGSFLTIFPKGTTRPTTSTINWNDAAAVANTATVPLGTDDTVSIYNLKGTVNVVIDLLGYYAPTPIVTPASPGYFYASNTSADLLPPQAALQFNSAGPSTSAITSNPQHSVFTVATAGVYKVSFSVDADNRNQFTIIVNDGSVGTDLTFGAPAGQTNVGMAVLTLAANDTITLENTTTIPAAQSVQLSNPLGGTDPESNAWIMIEKL